MNVGHVDKSIVKTWFNHENRSPCQSGKKLKFWDTNHAA